MPQLITDQYRSKGYSTGIHFIGLVVTTAENGDVEPGNIHCSSCMCPVLGGEECHAWLPIGEKEASAYCSECCASELEEALSVLE